MNVKTFATIIRILTAGLFVSVGVLHFVRPGPFVQIVPPYIPAPELMVYISGVFEVLGGIGLLVPKTRRLAGWGLIALVIVVFQANIYMLVEEVYLPGMPHSKALLWGRMPFQFLFLAMIWLSMKQPREIRLQWSDDDAFSENITTEL